jgi:hypothetical protein
VTVGDSQLKNVETLSPADLHSARHGAGVQHPTVDETVLWYMTLHPEADETQVRAEVMRRAKRLDRDGPGAPRPPR